MKTKTFIMVFALCAAAKAMALDQTSGESTSDSTSAKLQTRNLHITNPFAQPKVNDLDKTYRAEGISSRPWTQIVGWHPGDPPPCVDPKNHESQMRLIWFGVEPEP
jgi:hypothetical protein